MALSSQNNSVTDVKPVNNKAVNITPNMGASIDLKPNNSAINDNQTIYTESRTINAGQSLPWGLTWMITYPTTTTFIGPRL